MLSWPPSNNSPAEIHGVYTILYSGIFLQRDSSSLAHGQIYADVLHSKHRHNIVRFIAYGACGGSCIIPRRACAGGLRVVCSCVSVCLSVCLSAKSHLTTGASLRPEIAVTDSKGNVGQKVFSETASLQSATVQSAIFSLRNMRVHLPSYERYQLLLYRKQARVAA